MALLALSPAAAANSYETELSTTGVETLHVDWANGDVELIADDSTGVRITASGGASSGWLDYTDFSVLGGEAKAVFDTKGRAGNISVDLTIRFPRGLGVEVTAGNGGVTVTGGSAVDIDAGNGNVSVSGVTGDTIVDAGNGNVELEIPQNFSAVADLDAGNGNVVVGIGGGFSGEVQVSDGNGNVEVTFSAVPEGLAVDARTGMGSVTTDLPGAEAVTSLMGGAISRKGNSCSLKITAGLGDIEVLVD
ncbi:MAG: hypothetical protein A2Y64_04355 [Candidatus Coatesbacteria bacterium RBG_13_66_14]|uniref:Adhesin domain-containing protein n=1 Tax=Candidatus Coatesbacteria bacterium RBG_13_66_14 TaxID=1817816 RepID=A0A1F5F5E4_9BACT|nr:MAG: hypothetical protein A2Y64_04355 [Candidatus Coatesbacteria bacterium RBG_13_66_14]